MRLVERMSFYFFLGQISTAITGLGLLIYGLATLNIPIIFPTFFNLVVANIIFGTIGFILERRES